MAVSHLLPCPRAALFPQGFGRPAGAGQAGRADRASPSRARLGWPGRPGLDQQGRLGLPQATQAGLAWPPQRPFLTLSHFCFFVFPYMGSGGKGRAFSYLFPFNPTNEKLPSVFLNNAFWGYPSPLNIHYQLGGDDKKRLKKPPSLQRIEQLEQIRAERREGHRSALCIELLSEQASVLFLPGGALSCVQIYVCMHIYINIQERPYYMLTCV